VRLLVTGAVLAALLGGLILYLAWPLWTGTTVVLATRPVDPFDLLRGQYLIIGYQVGSLPAVDGVEKGDSVWVEVSPDPEGVWRHRDTRREAPGAGRGDRVFLRARVTDPGGSRMQVRYGIEQYYVERGTTLPPGELTVEARVGRSGRARIVRLLIDGEPLQQGR
jgi:uncharacterized membrane-anchored protein